MTPTGNADRRVQARAVLRACPDGLTVLQIAKRIGAPTSTTARALHLMPDCYIDRWVPSPNGRGPAAAIWCAVEVPDHCPRPPTVKEQREAAQARKRAAVKPTAFRV